MKQKGVVNRIKFVLSSIGKPVYWMLLFPILCYVLLARASTYIVWKADTIQKHFSHLRKKKRKVTKSKKKANIKSTLIYKHPSFLVRHRILIVSLVCVLIAMSVSSYALYVLVLKDLPTPAQLIAYKPIVTTKIYDRNHVLLYKIYKDEDRTLVPLEQISPFLKQATIAIEDKDFYAHHGISLPGIIRSIKLVFMQGKIQGGSTITQQLVKNVLLSRERTLTRKLKEIVLALQVETVLSKNQILEMYLNNVAYGGSAYGIQEASQKYFHTNANDLSLAQASFLAGLPAAPSTYAPSGPNLQLAFDRQHEVLRRLVEDDKISPLEAQTARNEPLALQSDSTDIKAPHFVMYIRDLLARQYGDEVVSKGGLEVTTTLDYQLQQQVENIVATEVKNLTGLRVSNGAALVTNPKTGEILAMIGSHDYFDTAHDGQVNVTLRPRQPGSSVKPLMYSAALENGYTPATIIDDSPIIYQFQGSPPYAPKNYDGTFHGNEPLRFALANSHNVPAVKTEAAIGLATFIDNARKLGITTWNDTSRFGLSLTLGSGEVLMTDMATAYGVFANGGTRIELNPLLTVKTYAGEILYENPCALGSGTCDGTRVMDPRIAFQITSILSDNMARSRAFGLNSVLNIPGQQVAVKTGTTNNLRDNWTFGYTDNRLVATWVGNNDNRPMSNVTSGITGASPIWNKIMKTQLNNDHPHIFNVPDNLEAESICFATGKPPCQNMCQDSYLEYFLPGTAPAAECGNSTTAQVLSTPTPSPRRDTRQAAVYTTH